MILTSYLIAGVFAGLVAGLFGVGGGIVIVPVLIFAFEAQGFSSDVLTHMAIATSLATIVFTSASSVYSHERNGSVMWDIFKPMSIGIVLGAVMGVYTVVQLDGVVLKKLFGIFAVSVSVKMLMKRGRTGNAPLSSSRIFVMAGVVVAWVSSIFGIGGGTLTVPFLSRYDIQMRYIVGTAAACGFPIALAGAVSNILIGQNIAGRPDWSVGLVYLPALLGVTLTSVYFAKVGAQLAHRLPSALLHKLFSIALMLVGIRFLLA